MSAATLERIRGHLVGLKMPRALEALDGLVRQLERGELSALRAPRRPAMDLKAHPRQVRPLDHPRVYRRYGV